MKMSLRKRAFEMIDNDRKMLGYENYESFDPVATVLEHILKKSRQLIEELTGYDFLNDFSKSGSEIYTY